MDNRYNPIEIEEKWYKHWMDQDFFSSTPDEREAYTIVIPPPNVTGVLHMGHMLNNTIQDVLIRRARMQGYNACWVPGTDHASIATEAKVVKLLAEQGISKGDITRDEFMEHAHAWKDKYGGIILQQLRKLGVSCDWNRTRFTMEESLSIAVVKSFVDLHKKGKLYRGTRINHWDPEALTALSDQEVYYKEKQSKLYHVRYFIEGTKDYVVVATTRPETILGDTAVCFHPEDERYTHLKEAKLIVPLVNRTVPGIFDDYVDREFGTGALKVTPAHDANDYNLGKKYNLETIDVFTDDAKISKNGKLYIGQDRFKARKSIVADLEEAGLLEKVEEITNSVGYSERTHVVVEPKLTLQWYMSMRSTSDPALEAVMNDTIKFFPEKYKNVYRHWLENIRDWCVSRQLWWGQRIPAYYLSDGSCFVAESIEEALEQAIKETGNSGLTVADLKQDEDVVDTWFSSWLWPISVFDGFEREDEVSYYYPTSVLVTGWDIIFLWVARMVMAGIEYRGEIPFKSVYFTGMVRDLQGRKMSKSLGNSPDPLDLISEFGADGVRVGILLCSPAGGDLLFDTKLCEQGRNFSNKIWNGLRLVKGWEVVEGKNEETAPVVEWMENKLSVIIEQVEGSYETFRLSEILKTLYSFVWNSFFSGYLEMIKPDFEKPIDKYTYDKTIVLFERLMQLLHPFMPFITEEVWYQLKERSAEESICVSTYPIPDSINQIAINKGEKAFEVLSKMRDVRNKNGLKQRELLSVSAIVTDKNDYSGFLTVLKKKAYIKEFNFVTEDVPNTVSFLIDKDTFFVETGLTIDVEKETERLTKEIEYLTGLFNKISKKLNNERFVSNAPEQVVLMERKKQDDCEAKIQALKESLSKLS